MGFFRAVVHRPVLVSVAYLIIIIFGVVALTRLPIDMLPDVKPPVLSVVTPYPGASALDVESKVTEPVEEALGTVAELLELSSISRENLSIVTLRFGLGRDLDQAANDVRQQLETAREELPADAEASRVVRFDPADMPVVVFAITSTSGDVALLRDLVDDEIIEPVRRVSGVGAVTIRNAPRRIVRVDVEPQRLLATGLTMTELAGVLAAENVDVPAGELDVGTLNFALRMPGEARTLQELRQLTVSRSPSGGVVTLNDLATVTEGLEDQREVALVNGVAAIVAEVRKVSGANTVEVADGVKETLERLRPGLPPSLAVEVLEDTSAFIKRMIVNLERTVGVGGVLVLLVVALFLRRLRPSLVVATTIPTSLVFTFLVLHAMGLTLNAVSLIAMALAVGMVVDNGVVVLENITRLVDAGMEPVRAAERGAWEVGGALLASTSTTLVIFLPLIFVGGMVGQLFTELAIVMIATIAGSLVVAVTLTPALAARLVRPSSTRAAEQTEEEELTHTPGWIRAYGRLLAFSLRHPLMILGGSGALAASTLLIVSLLGTDYLPQMDTGDVGLVLELPVGTGLETTRALGERAAAGFLEQPETEITYLHAGSSSSASGALSGGRQGSNVVHIKARLVPSTARQRSQKEVARAVLAGLGPLPEVVNVEVTSGASSGGGLGLYGKPVSLEVLGHDLDALQEVAGRLQRAVASIPGTVDVSADLLETRPELQVKVHRELASRAAVPLGLAGAELRAAMTGVVATRFAGDGDPRNVVVRFADTDRAEVDDWRQVPVRSRMGTVLTLGTIAGLREGESPIEVRRVDKSRVVAVTAGILGRPLGEVGVDVDAMLAGFERPQGVTIRQSGSVQDQRDAFADLGLMMGLGLLLVYLVMAAQFESWLDPLVIMFSVPFAATGAFLALLVTGTTLSITGFLGLIILIGIVVNNAIVLVDYIKLLRREGADLISAVRLAGRRRLRPVLITTLTTMGGMLPLALAAGDGAELWGPMGRTALGGLAVSTGVTLVLVPVVYVLVQRTRERLRPSGVEPVAG